MTVAFVMVQVIWSQICVCVSAAGTAQARPEACHLRVLPVPLEIKSRQQPNRDSNIGQVFEPYAIEASRHIKLYC